MNVLRRMFMRVLTRIARRLGRDTNSETDLCNLAADIICGRPLTQCSSAPKKKAAKKKAAKKKSTKKRSK